MTRPLIQSGDITTSTGTGTGPTPTFPDYVSGDLLIMFVGMDDDFAANNLGTPSTGPNGETLIVDSTGSGGSSSSGPTQGVIAWVGNATVSSSTITFTASGSEFWTGRCIKVLAGEFDATTPIGALSGYAGNTSSSATTIATPAWTLNASDGGGAIVVHITTDADPITGNPSGWTITVNTDHGGVATAITQRDADSVDSENVASVNYTIASDSSSTVGLVVRPPDVTHTADGAPSIILPTTAGVAQILVEGAITRLSTAASVSATTLAHTVPAGSDRMLVAAFSHEHSAATSVTSVAYGGQAMVQAEQIVTPDAGTNFGVSIWYLLDAGIVAASTNVITPTYSTAPADSIIHAASYAGVEQAGGATTNPATSTAETNEATPNPIIFDLTEVDLGAVIAVAGCGNVDATDWASDMGERTDQQAASSHSSFADRISTTDANVNIEATTVTTQNRAAGCAASFAAVSAGETADGAPSIILPTTSGTAEVINKANVGTELTDRGLLVRYFYDEAASGTGPTAVIDRSGNGYDLDDLVYDTPETAYIEVSGNRGIGSLSPLNDGIQRHAIDNASDLIRDALASTKTCTFEIVVTVDDISASNSRLLVINDRIGGNPVLGITSSVADEYKFFFNKVASGDNNVDLVGGPHVVTVVVDTDEGTTANRVRFYINGVADETVGLMALGATLTIDANVDLTSMNRESTGVFDRNIDGIFYYGAIYDVALTASEVADNAALLLLDNDEPIAPSEIALPTSSGAAEVIKKATGAAAIILIAAAGVAELTNTATGAPEIILPTTAGSATVTAGDITADGAPSIILPTAAGVATITKTATGAPEIILPTTAGAAEVNNTASGAPEIILPTTAGVADVAFAAKDTSVRVTFGTPTNPLAVGLGLQRFNMNLRRDAAHVGGSGVPTVDVYLYEDGVQRGTALLTGVPITSDTGQVVTALWDASDLVTAADGSAVECFVDATANGAGADRRAVEVGAIEWCSVALGGFFANGAPPIPLPTTAGTANLDRSATGAPSIILPTAAGVAEVINTATGAPSIILPTAAGVAKLGFAATGAPSIILPTTAGVAEVNNTATGAPSIILPTTAGVAKLGLAATGAPSIILPTAAGVAEVINSATGVPSIILPTTAGVAKLGFAATGAPSIILPTTAGVARLEHAATGAPVLPLIESAGSANTEGQVSANGAPSIILPTTAGTASIDRNATGAPSIILPTTAGTAEVIKTATGAPSIILPTAAGVAELANTATGAPSIILPTAAGVAEVINSANGAPSIILPTTAGVATVSTTRTATGAPSIILPTAAGVAGLKLSANGAPVLPLIQAAGTAKTVFSATGAPSIILPTAAGVAEVTNRASGAPSIILPTAAGVAEIINSASGAPTVPLPTAAGVAGLERNASGAPTIPLPTTRGTALLNLTGLVSECGYSLVSSERRESAVCIEPRLSTVKYENRLSIAPDDTIAEVLLSVVPFENRVATVDFEQRTVAVSCLD